jgi:ligand-binding sensor domain-containing protein
MTRWRLPVVMGQAALGILVVAACAVIAWLFYPRPKVPPGWQVIHPPDDVSSLLEVNDVLWAGGKDGIARINRSNGGFIDWIETGLSIKYVNSLTTDGSRIWVGHDQGLSIYLSGEWQTVPLPFCTAECKVLNAYFSPHSGLWVGTTSGLGNYINRHWSIFSSREVGVAAVSVMHADRQGRLWAGDGYSLEGGLSRYDGTSWVTYRIGDGLAHNSVNAILELPDGTLWFGTGLGSRGGASHFDGLRWGTLTREDGLAGERVRSIFLDRGSNLWFGSEVDGLALFDGSGFRLFTPDNGLAGWEVKVMLQDSTDNLWLGTERGLTRIDAGAWKDLTQRD